MSQEQGLSRRTVLKAGTGAAAAAIAMSQTGGLALAQDRPKVRIWSPGDNGTVSDWSKDPILQVVQDATGTEIEITKIGFDTYPDQINAAVASGEVPDVLGTIDVGNRSIIAQYVRDGVVTAYDGDLAPLVPNVLAQYAANQTLSELKIDDHVYMKPVSWADANGPGFGIIHVRKDVLDGLGMQPPDTFDQYFDFLRAAKNAGSTGVIFGAGGDGGLGGALEAFTGAYGVPAGGWVKSADGYGFWAIQPGTRDGLLLFRRMVADDLVDPVSWELTETPRDRYVAGQPYSMIWNGGGHIGRIQNDMDLAGTGAREWVVPALDNGKGSRGYLSVPSFFGGTFLGSLDGNDPEAAAKVVNYLSSPEGYKLTAVGIAGRDYREENGQIILIPEQRKLDGFPTEAGDTGAHPLGSAIVSWVPQEWQDFALLYGKPDEFKQWYDQMWTYQRQYLIETRGALTTSPLWTDYQSTSAELVTRSFLEIVRMGSEAEASNRFDQFVSDWQGGGGADATAEMSEVLTGLYG
jgi:putative aldouronate transport system substrate-binding protein